MKIKIYLVCFFLFQFISCNKDSKNTSSEISSSRFRSKTGRKRKSTPPPPTITSKNRENFKALKEALSRDLIPSTLTRKEMDEGVKPPPTFDKKEVAKLLNSPDFNPHVQDAETEDSLLHICAQHGNIEGLKLVLEKGVNANLKNTKFRTVLHYTAKKESIQMTRLVFELAKGEKPDPNIKDLHGKTPLHFSAFFGFQGLFENVATVLIAHGAKVNVQDDKGRTPLFDAACNDRTAVAQTLVENGANINLPNKEGVTPLHVAANCNSFSIIRDVLQPNHANINAKDKNQQTPLHYWAMHEPLFPTTGMRRVYVPQDQWTLEGLMSFPGILRNELNSANQTPLDIAKSHAVNDNTLHHQQFQLLTKQGGFKHQNQL